MKNLLGLLAILGIVGLLIWYGVHREMDKWAVCRNIGHGRMYCLFSLSEGGNL